MTKKRNLLNYLTLAFACAWPIVNFATYNAAYLSRTWQEAAFFLSIFVVLYSFSNLTLLTLRSIFGSGQDTARYLAACAVILIFFSFQPLMKLWGVVFSTLAIAVSPQWGYAITLFFVPLVALVLTNRRTVQVIVFAFMAVLVTTAGAELTLTVFKGIGQTAIVNTKSADSEDIAISSATNDSGTIVQRDVSRYPNIYHIVVDGYSRADQLQRMTGFDNNYFLAELQDQGFKVVNDAYANYPATVFSLHAIFSMNYPYTEHERVRTLHASRRLFQYENPVIKKARALGYSFGYIDTNFLGGFQCKDKPFLACLKPRKSILSTKTVELLDAMSRMTPVSHFTSFNRRLNMITTIDDVADIITNLDTSPPNLVFAHTLAPHAPYTRKSDCSPQSTSQFHLSGKLDPAKYVEAIECVNNRLISFSKFIEEKDPEAIVIFHSDHGSKFSMELTRRFSDWTPDQFAERFGVLLAIKAPSQCLDPLPHNFSLVNLYRLVFACISGEKPSFLENRNYVMLGHIIDQGDKNNGKPYLYPLEEQLEERAK